jgi:hypothetical protein
MPEEDTGLYAFVNYKRRVKIESPTRFEKADRGRGEPPQGRRADLILRESGDQSSRILTRMFLKLTLLSLPSIGG